MNTVVENIIARYSNPKLGEYEIAQSKLDLIIKAGMSANDHGHLKPWRFEIFKGAGRQKLANAYAQHELFEENLNAMEKAYSLPFRAPVVICVIATLTECKIAKRDQLFSAAGVCQLITLSAFSLGLGSIWRTGKYAESLIVKNHLNIDKNEEIVGFVYLGETGETLSHPREYPSDRVKTHE